MSSGLLDRQTSKDLTSTTALVPPNAPSLGGSAAVSQQAQIQPQQSETESALQIVEAIQQAKAATDTAEVTKNTTIPVLEPLVTAGLAEAEKPVAQQPETIDSVAAANFFSNAQANLSAPDLCAKDLKALAQTTKIYFPEGGVTAEDAGLIKGRVIGKIAEDCVGYTLEVRGHSDPSGDPAFNLALSKRRAESVIALLASAGVDTSGFVAVGMGDVEPSTIQGPKGNAYYDRRVDFSVVKTDRRTASLSSVSQPWIKPAAQSSACVAQLEEKAEQTRLFYGARSITVSPNELKAVYDLAQDVSQCEGARLRVVGQHSDQAVDGESVETGRLRALVLMGSLVSAGFESDQILVGALSYSVGVPGQPSLPKSRVDFQIIQD